MRHWLRCAPMGGAGPIACGERRTGSGRSITPGTLSVPLVVNGNYFHDLLKCDALYTVSALTVRAGVLRLCAAAARVFPTVCRTDPAEPRPLLWTSAAAHCGHKRAVCRS